MPHLSMVTDAGASSRNALTSLLLYESFRRLPENAATKIPIAKTFAIDAGRGPYRILCIYLAGKPEEKRPPSYPGGHIPADNAQAAGREPSPGVTR